MSEGRIHSKRVIMVEGDAGEFIPNNESAAGMHGFVVVVPPGEAEERFLDLVWRFTMVYAFMPSWLSRRAKVSKMLEAVMGKERREQKSARPPASKSGSANRTQRNRSASPSPSSSSHRPRRANRSAQPRERNPNPLQRNGAKAKGDREIDRHAFGSALAAQIGESARSQTR